MVGLPRVLRSSPRKKPVPTRAGMLCYPIGGVERSGSSLPVLRCHVVQSGGNHHMTPFLLPSQSKFTMQYTSDKPTEPGWYWCYNPSDHSEFVCRVDRLGMMLCASFMTAIGEAAVSFEHEWDPQVQWCGPLSTPEGRKEPRTDPPPAANCRCVLYLPPDDDPRTPEEPWTESEQAQLWDWVERNARSRGLLPYREAFNYEESNGDAT